MLGRAARPVPTMKDPLVLITRGSSIANARVDNLACDEPAMDRCCKTTQQRIVKKSSAKQSRVKRKDDRAVEGWLTIIQF